MSDSDVQVVAQDKRMVWCSCGLVLFFLFVMFMLMPIPASQQCPISTGYIQVSSSEWFRNLPPHRKDDKEKK